MADWGIPSERFVIDLLSSMTATSPHVVCGRHHPTTLGAGVPVSALMPVAGRVPYRFRRHLIRAMATGIAARHRSKLVHAHFGYWAAHAAVVAGRRRLPLVVSLHGYDLLVMAAAEPELDKIQNADAVIVPSQFLARAAVSRGFDRERLRVIPSGIDITRFAYRPRSPGADGRVHVTFAGRFVPKKGVLDAAHAMAAVSQQGLDLVCRFVGYGPQESELREQLRDLRLDAQVIEGRNPAAVQDVFADTHILLTPSRTADDGDAESLGLVNVEAQACGIPVVTTMHGGIPEAVTPDAGVLVPEGDVTALTSALHGLASTPDRWRGMGIAGRAHATQGFNLANRARDVEAVYAELLASDADRATSH